MSSNPTAAAGGQFAPVSSSKSEPRRVTANEIDVDLQNLDPTEREIVEADEFIIYGKANIEQWNRPGPGEDDLYIEMDAFEDNIDQLLALENISIGHNDVRIGEPLESHTLEGESSVHLAAGDTLTFGAGDVLRTQVIREGEPLPGDNGTADEDALWLVANLFGREDPRGSRFSQKARLGSYFGELDGFSVTVDKTEMTMSEEGTVVHDVDFLAVTVGDDELIKNPGSSFGVAEFQALFGSASAADDPIGGEDAVGNTLSQQLMSGILQRVFGSSKDALASQAIEHAYDEGTDLESAVEQMAGEENKEAVMQAVEDLDETLTEQAETLVDEAEDAEEIENRASELADEIGVDKEVVMAAVEEIQDMQKADEGEGPPDGKGEEGEENEEENGGSEQQANGKEEFAELLASELSDDADVSSDDVMEALEGAEFESVGEFGPETVEQAFEDADIDLGGGSDGVSEDQVEQMIDERMGNLEETVEEQLDDIGDNVAETISQQMETGSTPGPSGGGNDSLNLESQIDEMAEEMGVETE